MGRAEAAAAEGLPDPEEEAAAAAEELAAELADERRLLTEVLSGEGEGERSARRSFNGSYRDCLRHLRPAWFKAASAYSFSLVGGQSEAWR